MLFSSRHPQARKRLCTPAGTSSGKPDSNSLDCILFFLTVVSATCFSSNLQILLSLPVMYNCIYILPFLGFKDTPFANFASTSYVFDNVKMLLSKITHLQPALSIPCRCSPVKSRIRNLLFQCFADALHQNFASSISENPLSQISSLNILCCYSLHNLSQYITYKKIDIRNSSEYEMSVGDT